MGQTLSDERPRRLSREEVVHQLAIRFTEKCYTSLEVYSLKDVFKSLADQQSDIEFLKEDTIARFLELPDTFRVSPVLFQMISFIGAFPYLQDAPAVLGLDQMIMVITIMTDRYRRVLARGSRDRTKLFFKSLAVYDRKPLDKEVSGDKETDKDPTQEQPSPRSSRSHVPGFTVDQVGYEDLDEDDIEDDDDLEISALELLNIHEAVKEGDAPSRPVQEAMIPADNFRKLLMLLLLTAGLDAQESLSTHTSRIATDRDELEKLRSTAESILATFIDPEKSPGIRYRDFTRVIPTCLPHLFQGFNPLFEHFLFSKKLDHSPKQETGARDAASNPTVIHELAQPLLQDKADILDLNVLPQLSFFIPGSDLFRRLRLLYSGNDAGFSMGSFETKVFNWRAPTILLVRGTRVADVPHGGQEAAFSASLPPRRFPHGSKGSRLTFGLYLGQPWRHTAKECFGDPDSTVLFQLEPVHDVFPASQINRDYVALTKPPSNHAQLSVGCPHPRPSKARAKATRGDTLFSLGAVSLLLDDSFEYAVFNHDYTSRGGAFRPSVTRKFDFQDRFEVESLEVWGCGGDAEAKAQAEHWAWEAREAEARRKVNLGTGDVETDRALLEMAGLIGANRSGGSMG
ncbi:hypothetical protein ACRALDRAFT_1071044 [Sodiomyces alcalophilus JCM 7366]|uniref:uncharacterized protein n=1 Tax=Sodiomyces alcalophilus JCM 7366 TaxID=591952 RepID=UPI0039B64006